MSESILETARMAMKGALSRGAQGTRASVSKSRETRVEWRDGKLDRMRESTKMGLSLTLFVDGRYSNNSTNDLRPPALETFLDEAVAMTRVLDQDPARTLPGPERYEDRISTDLKLFDMKAEGVTIDSCREKAAQIEESIRSAAGSHEIMSVTGTCGSRVSSSAMVASNGMEGRRSGSLFYMRASVSVKDKNDRTQPGWYSAYTRHQNKLPPADELGQEALRRGLMGLGASPVKTGDYPCVIENVCANRILGFLLRPLGGSMLQQKRSFMEGMIGKRVTSRAMTLHDDPHVVEGLGSRAFDSEGMSTRRRPIFKSGVLRNYYLGTYYANKLGLEPTIKSRTNIIIKTGKRDLHQLLWKMGDGILITSFIGGNSNSASGDFSLGVRGQWIESGRMVRPVSGMNISGNHLEFWKNLAETGSDPFPYSSAQTPSMRFSSAQFSGV